MIFQTFHVNPGEKLKKKDVNNDLSNFMSVFPTDYSLKCKFCHDENSFEIHNGATFCINCGTESKEHGQELVYEIQDLIEDTESEEDDENLDYPDHNTDEEENNELSEDSDEFSAVDTNIKSNKIVKLLAQHSIFTTTTF